MRGENRGSCGKSSRSRVVNKKPIPIASRPVSNPGYIGRRRVPSNERKWAPLRQPFSQKTNKSNNYWMSLTGQCLRTAILSQVAMLQCILEHLRICWKNLEILKTNQPQIKKKKRISTSSQGLVTFRYSFIRMCGAEAFFFFQNMPDSIPRTIAWVDFDKGGGEDPGKNSMSEVMA